MDSFFSLFDPSEGGQNKQSKKKQKPDSECIKKNPDAPKGRRKGRRSHGKHETLPEESSFLCEPDLSTELLVKDCSYIENYIEVNKKEDDTKADEKKPKRRNSGRKYRRKKNKISPGKELVANTAWGEDPDPIPDPTSWNNQSSVPKISDDNIGKNVNDLGKEDFKRNRRKDDFEKVTKEKSGYLDRAVYHNVIDKLEKVSLKDEMYLAGDFNDEDLENDFFYSSDDMEDYFDDDTTSDSEDSGEECYGSLPPEPRFGNVEYKLQLVSPCERRFQHLVTQLKWRLRSGGGSAVYVVGVRDCGALRGLRARALRASLRALRRMAAALGAAPVAARARRLAPHRAVAEVYIRKVPALHAHSCCCAAWRQPWEPRPWRPGPAAWRRTEPSPRSTYARYLHCTRTHVAAPHGGSPGSRARGGQGPPPGAAQSRRRGLHTQGTCTARALMLLRRMAAALGAAPVAARARRLAPHRAVAEVYIRKVPALHAHSCCCAAWRQPWEPRPWRPGPAAWRRTGPSPRSTYARYLHCTRTHVAAPHGGSPGSRARGGQGPPPGAAQSRRRGLHTQGTCTARALTLLRRMAAALGAAPVAARARRLAPHRAVAEVYIRKLADTQQSVELRIAVMGANEAGKSTLIGVLTQGELDNGRGSARLNMFRHLHEVKSGRTSSLSHEILGFDAQGNVVNYGCSELMTAERIGERSAKLVSFLDLAGHTKYQRTTLHGLTGYSPHYAMIVISATAGITRITEEHIALLTALELPFFAVISKCELCPANVRPLVQRLEELLAPEGDPTVRKKKPLLITDENMARNCVAPQKSILDSIDNGSREDGKKNDDFEPVAVFPVSCVRGAGLNTLHAYLLALQPPASEPEPRPDDETCEFQIDEIFHVGDSTGPVVGGLLARGQIHEGDNLIIGPMDGGEFSAMSVRTVYRNRVACGGVRAGQSASLGLAARPPQLRPGMVLLSLPPARTAPPAPPAPPAFGTCVGPCRSAQLPELIRDAKTASEQARNRKHVRRKNKNLLQDIANVESCLVKPKDDIEAGNLYRSESDEEKSEDGTKKNIEEAHKCVCSDVVPLEDPNDPRGCLYFQATVRVLRHSTAIYPGFQCSVHVGNVRQTAIIEGIMSGNSELRAGECASTLFRFARCPEFLVRGRRLLFTAGLGTRGIGRITQVFPYIP